jgi:putative ABC transport system ATP-binding protein
MIQTQGLVAAHPGGPDITFPDVDVPSGGVLLLSGPSGSGKSTWLALVSGLMAPARGRLVVAQTPLTGGDGGTVTMPTGAALDAWRARHVGLLPQKLHLSGALTVVQNLAVVHWAAGLPPDPAHVAATLAALDVAELAGRRPNQLSGGQAQRVALARAVLLKPQVLLADEPTASLDDESARAALALLLQVASQAHATLVVATHDARVVAALEQARSDKGMSLNKLVLQRLTDKESQL